MYGGGGQHIYNLTYHQYYMFDKVTDEGMDHENTGKLIDGFETALENFNVDACVRNILNHAIPHAVHPSTHRIILQILDLGQQCVPCTCVSLPDWFYVLGSVSVCAGISDF